MLTAHSVREVIEQSQQTLPRTKATLGTCRSSEVFAVQETMKMGWSVSVLLLTLTIQSVSSVPTVHAPWGALQGISMQGDAGRKMDAYLGIPYAVPPVGDMRYEKPQPHPGPGKEVFVADKIMLPCPQKPMLIGTERKTSEDCLMLDVYVPAEDDTDSTTSKPYAVMVWIHGGGLSMGDAFMYRPSKLVVDGKVIVVTMQYRLGVLGFLSSGDGVVPENLGFWDQNLALRWVKDNIQAFGGDPERTTIFGESAGSWSVGLHLIMPPSKGLFNRAIMQSGAAQDLFHLMDHWGRETIFKNLTEIVGCQGDNSQQLLQCLKQQPIDHLMNKSAEYELTSPMQSYFFPAVDGELIPRQPRELLQDHAFLQENGVADVDIILGFNNQEGAMVTLMPLAGEMSVDELYTANFFNGFIEVGFSFLGLRNDIVLKKTTEFFYRGADYGSNVSQSLAPVADLFGDYLMTVPITEWARYLADAPHSAARYMYVVDHDFAFNSQALITGAHHGDELLLLFDTERGFAVEGTIFHIVNKTSLSEEEQKVSAKMVQLWTTFAKTGNPSPVLQEELGGEWPQFNRQQEQYLSFSGSPRVVAQLGPYRDRVAFWLNLLPELDALTSPPADQEAADQGAAREEL